MGMGYEPSALYISEMIISPKEEEEQENGDPSYGYLRRGRGLKKECKKYICNRWDFGYDGSRGSGMKAREEA
jgi:hypothetical protein